MESTTVSVNQFEESKGIKNGGLNNSPKPNNVYFF